MDFTSLKHRKTTVIDHVDVAYTAEKKSCCISCYLFQDAKKVINQEKANDSIQGKKTNQLVMFCFVIDGIVLRALLRCVNL